MAATSRIIWINRSIRDELEAEGKGFIYTFWHGRQVFLAYLHQGGKVRPLISQSRDGELIARVCHSFGLEPVRGSSSKGASAALRQLVEAVQSGAHLGITPDGPRGPLREIHPGVIFVARKTGRPIVPMAFGARKKWIFKSWDEFLVPKPFNRIVMVYGEPIWVKPTDDIAEKTKELQTSLNFVMKEADRVSGVPCG